MILRLEDLIHRLASSQHGLVTRRQLLAAGVTPRTVEGLVRRRRLRPVHRGVYLAGPPLSARVREMAAVLACGPDAAVSHRSAGGVRELMAAPGRSSPVEVTVCGADRGRRPGIRAYRVRTLRPEDVEVVDGIPVTTALRTILDLAAVLSMRELERAVARAERQGLLALDDLLAALDAHPGRRGWAALRLLIREQGGPAFTRSPAEEDFIAAVRAVGLPAPETNVVVAGCEVDCLWRRARIVVEIDGWKYHRSRERFANDRRRDARLAAAGFNVIRVASERLATDSGAVMVELAQALARAEGR